MRTLLGLALALLLTAPVLAAPSGKNAEPTLVVVNGDGTVLVSTTATSQWCVQRSNGGGCNIRISVPSGNAWSYWTDGLPATLDLIFIRSYCPCTAQFWEHAGQWHPFSAPSEPFTP